MPATTSRRTTSRKSSRGAEKTRGAKQSPEQLARALAVLVLPSGAPNFGEALEDHDISQLFVELCQQLIRSPHNRASDAWLKRFERVQEAAPERVQKDLIEYDDMRGEQEAASQEAAFRVGFEVGRRMAGGLR